MKIKRFFMEDWLVSSKKVKYNLAESGCEDFFLHEFLDICNVDIKDFENVFMGDNLPWGSQMFREEICKSYDIVSPENIMVSNGTSESLFSLFNTMLGPNDEVIVPFPAFQSLYQVPLGIGCDVKFLKLKEEDNWRINLKVLEEMVTEKTKLIIINSPHNPFGWSLSEEELKRIAIIAKENDAHLLFDEHYRYLPLSEGTDLLLSGYDVCRPIHEKVYATGSMIKCFGIVGIRIGWLIADSKTLSECIDYKDYLTHTIPAITEYLAFLSLKNKDRIIAHKKKSILANVKAFERFMRQNDHFFEYTPIEAGVVCFPKVKEPICVTEFCQNALNKYGVSLLPGFTFEMDNHIRVNLGIDHHKFENALSLVQKSVDEMSKIYC